MLGRDLFGLGFFTSKRQKYFYLGHAPFSLFCKATEVLAHCSTEKQSILWAKVINAEMDML